MILLRLFQESKNIIFTCGDSKNHSWPSPLVIFSVPTRENNVFTREYTKCTAGSTFCFVVVVVVVVLVVLGKPLIKLASISADS
jgi:hypothetical protein